VDANEFGLLVEHQMVEMELGHFMTRFIPSCVLSCVVVVVRGA